MKYSELKKFREQVYKDFIQAKYGREKLDELELAVNIEATDRILRVKKEKDFVEELLELKRTREESEKE